MEFYFSDQQASVPIVVLHKKNFSRWREQQSEFCQHWLAANEFQAKEKQCQLIPDAQGHLAAVVLGVNDDSQQFWQLALAAEKVPAGQYHLQSDWDDKTTQCAVLAWGLAQYRFARYKTVEQASKQLKIPDNCDATWLQAALQSYFLIRDLINTPMEDLGPEQFADVARHIAERFSASFQQIVGEDLLQENFPAIHAVGRASSQAPRLVEINWGHPQHPLISLVGKGVCFDSGGLDLKPSQGMRLMKKDMGGAAHVLGLAQMIMQMALPVRIQVLLPLVENAVSGNALRPGDVIASRSGKTIEIGNTDAEGRVILADALTYAGEANPSHIIDMATLTGAARVALGTEVPVFFTNQQQDLNELMAISDELVDPIWPLPLFKPYQDHNKSSVADITNAGSHGYGGAITAALFLQAFVKTDIPWIHVDLMAYNLSHKPGRPEGGEAMALRTLFEFIEKVISN